MKYLPFLVLFVITPSVFVVTHVYSEEQVPGSVLAVESDPYYFSEGGFGIGILQFFDRPMGPYLVPGKTTDQSSLQEIYQAYVEEAKGSSQGVLVDDDSRATVFITDFSGGDLTQIYRFNSFQKFTHIEKTKRGDVPYYYENVQYGIELESLPSEDKKIFYESLGRPSIN